MFKFKLFDIDATFNEVDCSLSYDNETYYYSKDINSNDDKTVYFKLNNKCNLKCIYCYQKEEETDSLASLNLIHYEKLINSLFDEYDSFQFFGGEPFISINYTNIKYLLNNCKDKKISAFTNGTFDETYYHLLVDCKDKIQSITITLDGFAAIHDSRRINANGTGTFDSIITNIKKLCEQKIPTIIQINVDGLNYNNLTY
jgi:uncharacterized protein